MSQIEELKINRPHQGCVMIVQGPTASGKSGLALELAQQYDGIIINADAMQVYQGIPIVTAAPSIEDKQKAEHRLYEIFPPEKNGSVTEWLDLAVEEIKLVLSQGRLPIVTGGTGFYIESLTKGVSPIPETKENVKAEVAQIMAQKGVSGAWNYLQSIDEKAAQMVKPNDMTRVRRALEIKIDTGISIAEWFTKPLIKKLGEVEFNKVTLLPQLNELEQRCAKRFEQMIKDGAIEEVKALLARDIPDNFPAMKAIGVPELRDYLQGKIGLEEAVRLAVLHSRQYAKRQLTWFRHRA